MLGWLDACCTSSDDVFFNYLSNFQFQCCDSVEFLLLFQRFSVSLSREIMQDKNEYI